MRLADSKTGPKTLYLSGAATVVLAGFSDPAENPWVLPGRVHGRPLVNPQKPWRRMRALRAWTMFGYTIYGTRLQLWRRGAGCRW